MRAYLAFGALLALSASSCNRKPGIDMTDVPAAEVEARLKWTGYGEVARRRPGQWRAGRQLLSADPPAPRNQYEAGWSDGCLQPNVFNEDPIGSIVLGTKWNDCRYKYFRLNDGKLDALAICGESINGSNQVHIAGTFSPEGSEVIQTSVGEYRRVGGVDRTSTKIRIFAHRIGECSKKDRARDRAA